MIKCFPQPKSSGERRKVELDLSNYAIKEYLKNATGVDTSKFAKKVDLANLKSNVDNLDIDELKNLPTNLSNLKSKINNLDVEKLVTVPVDLSKLGDVAKNDVVKKMYIMLRSKVLRDKIPEITNLTTNATLNAKKMRLKVKYLVLLT